MSRSLGVLTLDLIARTGGFEQGMDRASRRVRATAGEMESARRVADRMVAGIAAAAAGFAAAAGAMAVSAARSLDATSKMAQQIGTTTEALTGMRFAAQQFANISDQQFDMSMRRMTRRIAEAAEGSGAAKGALDAMGLSARELARLSPEKQMLAIADAMQRTERQADRLRYTMAIFDTEGMALVPALQQGAEAFEQNIALARQFGVVISTDAAQAADQFLSNMNLLNEAQKGFKNQVAEAVLPTLADLSGRFVEIARNAGDMGERVATALKVIGVAAAATATIITSRLIASIVSKVGAWGAATIAAARYQAQMTSLSAAIAGANRVVSASAATAAAAATTLGRAGQLTLAVLGGPAGLAAAAAITGAAFLTMGRNARDASVDIDELSESFKTLSTQKLELRLFDLEDEVKRLEDQARESGEILAGVEKNVKDVYESAAQGVKITAEELENARRSLLEQRDAHATNNAELDRARTLLNQVIDHLERMRGAAHGAAGGVNALNQALHSEAGEKYLVQLQGQIKALQDGGDPIKIATRWISEHADATDADKAAIMSAAHALKALQAARAASTRTTSTATKTLTEAQRAAQAFRREQENSLKAQYREISALNDQAKALDQQISLYGLAESAKYDLAIADLERERAAIAIMDRESEEIAIIERKIELLNQMKGSQQTLERLDAEKQAWENWSRDVEQIFDRVGQSLTDAIFDGGKSGKELLEDIFKSLTFNVLINPVMNQMQGWVTNQLGGMFGVQNPAQGGVGILGAAQGASSIYSALTGGLTSGIASVAAGIGNAIGSSALTSFAAGMKGSTLAAGLAGPTTAGATGAMGFGAMAANALPYIGVGLAALSLLSGSFKGEKRYGGGYEWAPGLDKAYYSAGPSGKPSAEVNDAIGSMIASAANTIEDVFKGIGSNVSVTRLAGSAESSEKGRGGTASGGYLDIAGELVQFGTFGKGTGYGGTSGSLDEMVKNLEVDLYHTILEAWQAGVGEFPVVLQEMIAGLDPSALTGEQAQAIIAQVSQTVQAVNAFKDAVEKLPFANLRDLSFDAAANLIQFAGSLEALESGMTTYFQNFYSQEEQLAFAAERMTGAFADLGFTMPDLSQGADSAKASYRALVESLDLTTEEGQRAYVTLMSLAGGFSELVTGLDDLAAATARAAEEAARAAEQAARNEFERLARVGDYQLQEAISQLNAAWSAVQHHAQQEISRLEQTFSQTDSLWSAYQSSVRSLESELGGLLTTISRGVADLRGQVDATAQMQYAQARAVISTAVVTGQLPQTADLTEAMRVAQQGVAAGRYGSAFEQREAYLKLAAEMEALQGIAQPELDAAQASLEMLEKQFNRLRGIEGLADQSLSQLERQLAVAFSTEEAARTQIAAIEGQLAWAERQYNALLGIGSGITDLASAFRAFKLAAGAVQDAKTNPVNRDQQYLNAKLDQLRRENPNYGGVDWTTATVSDLAAVFRKEGMTPEQHYKLHGRYEGLSYDTGTSYVPYDMTANIHKGEIIIDPRSSDILRRYGIGVQGGGSREMVAELRSLRAEVSALRSEQKSSQFAIAKHTQKTARLQEKWDAIGMPHEQAEVSA